MGGKSGGGSAHTPYVATDTLRSVANAYVMDALCEGPIGGFPDPQYPEKYIKLNGTPIQNEDGTYNFQNVKVDWRLGFPDQSYIPGFFIASSEISQSVGLPTQVKASRSVTVTVNEPGADELMLRFSLAGLQESKTNGDVVGAKVEIKVEIKDSSPGSGWVEVSKLPGFPKIKDGKASSKYEWSARVALDQAGPNAPWQIRVSRVTPDSSSQTLVNDTWFEGLAVIKNQKLRYPCVALCAVKADAAQFNAIPNRSYHIRGMIIRVPSNYDPVSRIYTGNWDGSFKMAWSSNPAWCFYDLLVESRYGLGDWIRPEMVDKWGLYEIGKYCDELVPSGRKDDSGKDILEPRFALNCYIQTQEEAVKVVQMMASSFHAMTYWASGAVFAAQDRPLDPSYLFTPANVKEGRFVYSSTARRARHNAIVVQWNDPENTYKLEPELFEMEDAIRETGFRFPTDRVAFGCTSRGQALRDARWTLFSENFQPEVVTFGVGMEGAQLRPGDIVAAMDPTRSGKSWGGRVRSRNGAEIQLDREVTLEAGQHNLIITTSIGTITEGVVVTPAGTTDRVTLDRLDVDVFEGAVWILASENTAPELWRVVSVVMEGEGEYSVTAAFHCPEKFDWIEKGLVLEDRRKWTGSDPASQPLRPPQGLVLSEYLYKDKEDLKVGVHAQWAGGEDGVRFLPSWRRDNENWVDLPATSLFTLDVRPVEAPCSFTLAIRAQNLKGETTQPTTATLNVLGKQQPPKNVTNLKVKLDDSVIKLTWDVSDELDVPGTEIREGGTSWETATLVAKDVPNGLLTLDLANTRSTTFWAKHRDTWTPPNYSLVAARVDLDIYSPVDGDVLSVARKRELALQWAVILAEQTRLDALANSYGINHGAYDTAIAAVPTFFSTRNQPKAWTDFSGPTYLGAGGGALLTQLFNTIKDEQVKLSAAVAVGNMAFSIASGATDAMLKSGYLDGNGKVRWDKLQMAVQTIFASQLYIANWDNLIPNPNSEQPAPSGGWPSGVLEGAGVVYGNAADGSYCRYIPPYSTLVLTSQIPCGSGDQFAFRAQLKGSGGTIGIRFNGSQVATATSSSAPYQTKECATTTGAPGGTTYVDFVITAGSTGIYADNLYARRMNDGLLQVDGSVKAQHLEAVMAITGVIKSPNWQAGTGVAAPQGFYLSGPAFTSYGLGGFSQQVNLELGRGINLGGYFLGESMDRLWNAMNRVINGTIGGTMDINPWSVSSGWGGWIQGVDTLNGLSVAQYGNGFPVSYNYAGNEGSLRTLAKKGSSSGFSSNSFSQSLVLPKPSPQGGATVTIKAALALAQSNAGSDSVTGQVSIFLYSPAGGSYSVGTLNLNYSGAVVNVTSGTPSLNWQIGSWDVTSILNAGGPGDWRIAVSCLADARGAADASSVAVLFADEIKLVV